MNTFDSPDFESIRETGDVHFAYAAADEGDAIVALNSQPGRVFLDAYNQDGSCAHPDVGPLTECRFCGEPVPDDRLVMIGGR